MSETKHTPLPWKVVAAGAGVRASISQLYKLETPLRESGKTFGEELDEHEANAALFQQSVNARPKVEELVKLGLYQTRWEHIFNRLLATGGDKHIDELRALRFMLREVEAALGGKAE